MPGRPDSWVTFHEITALPSLRNDLLEGVTELNDGVIVWQRTRTLRIRSFPIAGRAGFDIAAFALSMRL